MGGLAKWGAIAGGASGAQQNIEYARKKEMADLDEQRETRLKQLEDQMASQRQERGFQQQEKMQGMKGEQATKLQGGAQEFKSAEAEKQRQFEAVQTDKELEAKKEVAGIQAGAKGSSAGLKRWEAKTTTQTRTGQNGIPEQYDSVALFDKASGRTYIQQGSRFVPQGTDPKAVRRAPREAIADLLSNTSKADAFIEAYNYLPIEFFGALQGQSKQPAP